MTRAGSEPGERRERALIFLAQLAVLHAGYRVGGVFGWAHADDLALLAGPHHWPGLLCRLTHAGEVSAVGVRGPRPDQRTRLFRIGPAGLERAACILGESAPDVAPPGSADEDALYVSAGAWWALGALREAERTGVGRACLTTVRARIRGKHALGPCPVVLMSDLRALVAAELAERACPRYGSEAFALTEMGWTAEPLAWRGDHPEAAVFSRDRADGPLLRCPTPRLSVEL